MTTKCEARGVNPWSLTFDPEPMNVSKNRPCPETIQPQPGSSLRPSAVLSPLCDKRPPKPTAQIAPHEHKTIPTAQRSSIIVGGLDLGQSVDHSALILLECLDHSLVSPYRPGLHVRVIHINQYPLGTNYLHVARDCARKINKCPRGATFAVDARGPGKPVIDILSFWPGLSLTRLLAISATSSNFAHHAEPHPPDPAFLERWSVPKEWLFSTLTWLLNTGRFSVGDGPQAGALKAELRQITTRMTATGYIKHEARTGHDDIVLAAALACWAALLESGDLSPLFPDSPVPINLRR